MHNVVSGTGFIFFPSAQRGIGCCLNSFSKCAESQATYLNHVTWNFGNYKEVLKGINKKEILIGDKLPYQ